MTIQKILNNNTIVTRNAKGQEIVAMGNGLGFHKRPGDEIDLGQIDKVYTLSDKSIASKFQMMLAEIPMEHMLLSERVIDYAKTHLGKKLNDCIYVTLPDHISTAISRYKENLILENPLLWDIRHFYPDEFAVGLKANQIVLEETGIQFIEDEAAFITMHFINAELNGQIKNTYSMTEIIQEICTIIKEYFQMEFDESSLSYSRFINHLKFFAQRLLIGGHYKDGDDDLLDVIKNKHQDALQCAEKIRKMVLEKYHYDFGKEELLYLTVHIARITQNPS